MIRDDIQGVEKAPESVATYLLRKGGKNPYGEPNFRLIWSPSRVTKRGGAFSDWDKNIACHERGGVVRLQSGLLVPNGHTPIRTVIEVRTVRKYAFDAGWVLERWVPTTYYGNRGDWEMNVVPHSEGVPLLGPYPEFGDYEMCHNSASIECPSISELQRAIDLCEYAKSQRKEDVQQVVLERHNAAVAEYDAELERQRQETENFVREIMRTNLSTSLQMGAHRTRVAEAMGIREHVGN